MSTVASMMTMALRLVQNAPEIQKMWPRVQAVNDEAQKTFKQMQSTMDKVNQLVADVQALARKVAPELLPAAGRAAPAVPNYNVRWLQEGLRTLGFDPGPIDGDIGPRTTAAIKAFQKANGLVVDGWAGVATEAALDNLLRGRT